VEPAPLINRAAGRKLKLAIIGCGAVARTNHLPAALASAQLEPVALVDAVASRAEKLAVENRVPHAFDDYRRVIGLADAAVVAVPNHLHAPVAVELLHHGLHVLVEKPMGLNTAECDAIIAAARASGAALAVGLEFRYFTDSQFIKDFLAAGLLGPITSFDLRLGMVFNWPLASDYLLHKETAGGGVLMDFGAHVLDLVLWWLGDYAKVRYADDSRGGVEANCSMDLEMTSGALGVVELSRTRTLRNSFIVTGERGRLEVALWTDDPLVRLGLHGGRATLAGRIEQKSDVMSCEDAINAELEDFAAAIRELRAPRVNGSEARKSIALIQACYENRRSLKLPWSF
jgi:predicted dehydrogenase